MNTIKLLLITAAFSISAAAQVQTSSQAAAQANGAAGVQANQSQVQASSQSSAQSSASATASQTGQINGGVVSGTTFNAKLDKPLDAKKSKPGDVVTARTTDTVKSEGNVALPEGTKLIGHVTQASARAKGDSQSALGITSDRAILKNGQQVPVNLGIQAMASGQAAQAAELNNMSMMDNTGGSIASSGMAGGASTLGGLTGAAGTGVGTVAGTTGTFGRGQLAPMSPTLGSATSVAGDSEGSIGGLNSAGQFTSSSRGMFGWRDLSLASGATDSTGGSLITSPGRNVHLNSGTRMLMVTHQTGASVFRKH
jgi:hypothetical protein